MNDMDYGNIAAQYSNSHRLFKENRKLYREIDRAIGIENVFDIRTEVREAMSRYSTKSKFIVSECYYNRMANRYGISWMGTPTVKPEPVYCIYRWAFPDCKHVYIGLTKNISQRISAELRVGTVHDYIKESGQRFSISVLEDGLYPSDASEMERYYIVQSRLDGFIPINKSPGGTTGGCHARTDDELLAMASQYRSVKELCGNNALLKALKTRPGLYRRATKSLIKLHRSKFPRDYMEQVVGCCRTLREFMVSYPSEYCACKRNGWDDLLGKLARTNVPSTDVTDESIREAVAKCTSRLEFNTRFRRETYVAKKRGIYEDVVKHLPKQTGKRKDM